MSTHPIKRGQRRPLSTIYLPLAVILAAISLLVGQAHWPKTENVRLPEQAQADAQPSPALCNVESGYGMVVGRGEYLLDLQCRPTLPETIEIPPDRSILVTVDLSNYYRINRTEVATFLIHLAMQRANITIRQRGTIGGENIVDFRGALQSVEVTTTSRTFTFEIRNDGFRSAIFDLSVRIPRSRR